MYYDSMKRVTILSWTAGIDPSMKQLDLHHARTVRASVVAAVVSMSSLALGGRPLAIDDADPVPAGQFEVEAGVAYERDSNDQHWDLPLSLAYGWNPRMEVGIGFGGQLEERTEVLEGQGFERSAWEYGIGDLNIGGKWQLVEHCPLGARHALAASMKFPTADERTGLGSGHTDYTVLWIASGAIGDKVGIHLNLGHSWMGGPVVDALLYGVAFDGQMNDALQWVSEVFAETELAGGSVTVVQYNIGFRWSPTQCLTIDLAGGSTISGEGPDFSGTIGLTWVFGRQTTNRRN